MTVQMIENWAEIRGVVCLCIETADLPDFINVQVDVESVEPVAGYPNLLEQFIGSEIPLLVPKSLAETMEIKPGNCIDCWARRAGLKRVFVHQEHIRVVRCE